MIFEWSQEYYKSPLALQEKNTLCLQMHVVFVILEMKPAGLTVSSPRKLCKLNVDNVEVNWIHPWYAHIAVHWQRNPSHEGFI